MHTKEQSNNFLSAFRPSAINRFISCNLWRFLPQVEKTPEQEAYLSERSKDHERLEREEFLESETECRNYFSYVSQLCGKVYKENSLELQFEDHEDLPLRGTPDVFAFDAASSTLYILDYKTGVRHVQAEANTQLLAYAMLVVENFPQWPIKHLQLAILNTQSDSVSKFRYEGLHYVNILREKILEALEKNQNGHMFGVSSDHCTFCPARRFCPLHRDYSDLQNYADMDTDDLILATKKRRFEMNSRETAIKSGTEISERLTPLVRERLKRSWRPGVDLPEKFKTLKPMTFTEAEKLYGYREVEQYTDMDVTRYLAAK